MFRRVLLVAVLAQALAVIPAQGAVRELGQQELRQSVKAGRSLSLQRILASIPGSISGEPVDVRAFDAGRIYYHVLVMQPNGQLTSVVVDAATGRAISGNSAQAKAVREAARKNSGSNGKKLGRGADTKKGKSGSKGNSGGNGEKGGGNGGGNGGGGGGKK